MNKKKTKKRQSLRQKNNEKEAIKEKKNTFNFKKRLYTQKNVLNSKN